MKTWKKKDYYKDLHELSITCFVLYRPLEYLITGGKDGKSTDNLYYYILRFININIKYKTLY